MNDQLNSSHEIQIIRYVLPGASFIFAFQFAIVIRRAPKTNLKSMILYHYVHEDAHHSIYLRVTITHVLGLYPSSLLHVVILSLDRVTLCNIRYVSQL